MADSAVAARSNFVTTLAWILIVFSWLGLMVALMQNVMINFVMPAFEDLPASTGQRGSTAFPLAIFRVMGALMLAFSGFVVYAAYSLLRRRDWARRAFVVLFVLGICWSVFALLAIVVGVSTEGVPVPSNTPSQMRTAFIFMTGMFGVLVTAMAVLLGWLVKRLRSPAVKAEFDAARVVT